MAAPRRRSKLLPQGGDRLLAHPRRRHERSAAFWLLPPALQARSNLAQLHGSVYRELGGCAAVCRLS